MLTIKKMEDSLSWPAALRTRSNGQCSMLYPA
jgi:hypothetical protein